MSRNQFPDPVIALVAQITADLAKDRSISQEAAHELYVRAMHADLDTQVDQFLELSLKLTKDLAQATPPLGRELADAFQGVIPALTHICSFLRDLEEHPKDWPANRLRPPAALNAEVAP